MMRQISQSERISEFNGLQGEFRKELQRGKYLQALHEYRILENYRDGDLSLIIQVSLTFQQIDASGDLSGFLIFESDAPNSAVSNQWSEEQMLVRNVRIVKAGDAIVPSNVRLYIGPDPFVDDETGSIYFSVFKNTFYRRVIDCPPSVNCISGFGASMFDAAKLDIRINSGNVSVWQGVESALNIRDFLIGPLNFQV